MKRDKARLKTKQVQLSFINLHASSLIIEYLHKNHLVKSSQNIKLTLACQEILEPNVMLEPILRNIYNYKVIKGRIQFYIFIFEITIATGIAFFCFRTLLEKSLTGCCQRPIFSSLLVHIICVWFFMHFISPYHNPS